jgi:hypothetical protein
MKTKREVLNIVILEIAAGSNDWMLLIAKYSAQIGIL